ncbi:hypothetical protein DB30_03947 [Enhygromyxa salina]|uniref:Copper type II ascorbate-dependent monooxygenase C-terminal domain-containing protein n=1 Tax=Enhygromyxa salina TaxID=215803 RepID=A0A0C2A0N6_9BACT|nr:hypothetical protein [Enhygromyxa salina]KIG16963.1 hypothetical protein DB30_03947 [Enhygromyxa salina]
MLRLNRRLSIGFALLALAPACAEVPSTAEGDSTDTESGDGDGDGDGDGEGLAQETTWHQHIAPLMMEKCGQCHRADGIGPFTLVDYDAAASWAPLALEAVESGQMPPWGADETEECVPRHPFKDDPRLTDDQLALFADWIIDGTPEGDPATAAPIPELASIKLDDADLRLTIPGDIEVKPGADQFWCFVLDPGFTETTFIDATQVVAGNDKVVHHVLVYVDESGQAEQLAGDDGRYECFGGPGLGQPTLISAWAPGVPPNRMPEQVAMNVAAGAKVVVNVHYHPTGVDEVDTGTSLDIRFSKGAPLYLGQLALIGNFGALGGGMGLQPGPNDSGSAAEFRIPAGVDDHTETMIFALPDQVPDLKIFSTGTHMHYVGTDMLIGLDRLEPEEGTGIKQECLVQTPHYSFEWQRGYAFDAPLSEVPTAKAGDYLYMRCKYNNSMSNPFVVEALADQGLDAPIDVFLGEETLDEMCLGVFGIAFSIVP